jgi:transcriptional regulator with XRE-family HTH domain
MDFKDVSAKFKQKRIAQGKEDQTSAERNFAELYAVRARIVGLLIRDARIAANKSTSDIAQALDLPDEVVEGWEFGDDTPSLPQLELLAYAVDVPISHFFGRDMLEGHAEEVIQVPANTYNDLRNRVVALKLIEARKEARLSQAELAAKCGLSAEEIGVYEEGEEDIPFAHLHMLAGAVGKSLSYFIEESGRLGGWLRLQEEYERFRQLPPELRAFVSMPVNTPFMEIALRLSKMPLRDLRTVAEKILDITL